MTYALRGTRPMYRRGRSPRRRRTRAYFAVRRGQASPHPYPPGRSGGRHGLTAEHRRAFASFRTMVESLRLRVMADVEGFPHTPCRYGKIEYYDGKQLAAWTDHLRIIPRLRATANRKGNQVGDREARFVFSVSALPTVAKILRAHYRRRGTAQGLNNLKRSRSSR
jgi:hypothetical protein